MFTTRTLDRDEGVASYDLHISAIDKGDPPCTSNAVITVNVYDINDNAPEPYLVRYSIGNIVVDFFSWMLCCFSLGCSNMIE